MKQKDTEVKQDTKRETEEQNVKQKDTERETKGQRS